MSVVGIAQERPGSPRGNWSDKGASFTRKKRVIVSDPADGPIVVFSAPGVAAIGEFYATGNESHPFAFCKNREAERMGTTWNYWEVTETFETLTSDQANQQQGHENPLLEIPDIRIRHEKFQEPVTFLYDSGTGQIDMVTTTAEEKLSPAPMRDNTRIVLTIARNEIITANPINTILGYMDTLNVAEFWGQPARYVKFDGIDVERVTKINTLGEQLIYLRVTYTFHIRSDWDKRFLNAGTYYLINPAGDKRDPKNRKSFVSASGTPYVGLLDDDGTKLADATVPLYVPDVGDDPAHIYAATDFNVFSLPQSFLGV